MLASEDTKFISRSKFCDYLRIEGLEREDVCLARLKELGARLTAEGKVPIVIGSGDWYARILSKHRDDLSAWYVVPYIDYALLDRISQREGFYAACDRAGVCRPRVWELDCAADGRSTLPDDVVYPVAVQPSDPISYRLAQLPHKDRGLVVNSPAELRDLLDELRLSSYDATVVLESVVPGGDEALRGVACFEALRGVACFCDGTGELRSWSTGRVLAEDPLGAGEGAWDCVLLDRDDALAAQASKLLRSVGYRGFAHLDARFDARDGSYQFLRIDPHPGRGAFAMLAAQASKLLRSVGYRGFAHLDARFDARDGSYQFLRIDPHPGRGAFAMNIGGADIARLLVDEYVLGRTGPAQVACNPGIFTHRPPPCGRVRAGPHGPRAGCLQPGHLHGRAPLRGAPQRSEQAPAPPGSLPV